VDRSSLVPALLALALLAGCGDDEGTQPSTVTETVSASTSTEASSTTDSTEDTSTSDTEDGAPPPADRTVKELTGFTSPSGNIGCYIDRGTVRCDIAERDWEPPAAPDDCELDFGQGISMEAGGAPAFVCAGDTALEGGPPLDYGMSIASGLLRCESEEAGMTCRDIETGRGFTLSKERYELF
jgi:hypothetical protein